jgi:hypothetical protein
MNLLIAGLSNATLNIKRMTDPSLTPTDLQDAPGMVPIRITIYSMLESMLVRTAYF